MVTATCACRSRTAGIYEAVKGKVPAKFLEVKDMYHQLPWTPAQHKETLHDDQSFLKTDCGPGGL